MDVLLLGCGNMGGAMLQAWLPLLGNLWQNLWVLRLAEPQRQKLQARTDYKDFAHQIHLVGDLTALPKQRFNLIVLGVKPQVIQEQMADYISLDSHSLWFTMAAGLPLCWYRHYKSDLRILRIMPNLGAQVGQSASLLYKEPNLVLSQTEQNLLEQLVQKIGSAVWCRSEAQLDNATPITGSGPAYFYLLTELLEAELIKQGFTAKESSHLAEATFLGAAAYAAQNLADVPLQMRRDQTARWRRAAVLREAVTSKAGVTEAALAVLRPQLDLAFAQAVARGNERNRELQRN